MKKRLMVLGAGTFQLSGIKKAVENGFYVISVDNIPDNIGHRFSHEQVNCSTTDRYGVAAAAKKLSVDGICTFCSDVAVPSIAYTSEQNSFYGPSLFVAETMSAKHRFRSFLKESGLPCPNFIVANSIESIDIESHLHFPVVFKPVDTSGSRGVSVLYKPSCKDVEQKFELAKSFSRSGSVCIEEYVEGVEVGGDGMLVDGHFGFIQLTHKHFYENENRFVVKGHNIPTNIPFEDEQRVIESLENCCKLMGYTDGPLNFDVKVAPERVVILEMSPRNGGNGIASVIQRATGVDLELLTIKYAMGEKISLASKISPLRGAASWVFGNDMAGILASINTLDTIKTVVPEIFDFHLAVKPGNRVMPFQHGGNLVGYVLFDCQPPQNYDVLTRKIKTALAMSLISEESQESLSREAKLK